VVAAIWGITIAKTGASSVSVIPFVSTSLIAGSITTWHLGRRPASEVEDALTWAVAAGIVAALLPLVPLIVMLSGAA
jgi:hypothetical protein